MTTPPDATVILLRHGTSPIGSGRDRDRPLADGVADNLRSHADALAGFGPVRALVSTARRTVETADAVLGALQVERRDELDALYNADAETIRGAVEAVLLEGSSGVLLIGHNPGISAAAHELAGDRFAGVMRPGDAVVCERRDGAWRLMKQVGLEAE